MKDFSIRAYAGGWFHETGYGSHSRNFFLRLNKHIPVKVIPDSKGHLKLSKDELALLNTPEKENKVTIILQTVDHPLYYQEYDRPMIAFPVWESTRYPDRFFNRLLDFDMLWVPTQWHKKCAIEQGYPEDRVFVVHEGVDNDYFKPREFKRNGRFQFLHFGRWDYRKSTEELIKAFIEEFDGEDVELVLSVDSSFLIDGEVLGTEERLTKKNLLHKQLKIVHFLPRSEYLNYLQTGSCLVTCARAEGWNLPLCIPEGKLVITGNGLIPIEKIKVGDKVITHLGSYKKVSNTMSRYFNGSINKIYLYGDYEPLSTTPEHPIFVIKREKLSKKCKKSLFSNIENMEPEWIKSSEIRKGDVIVRTIISSLETNTKIDLKNLDDRLCFDGNKVWYNTGYNDRSELKTYNRFVDLKDLSFVLGWYIAKGCDGENRVWLTLNDKEKNIAEKWLSDIERVFGTKGSYEESSKCHRLNVRVNSVLLCKFFSFYCGKNAHEKKIPESILYGDINTLKILIDSYFSGDGCTINDLTYCSTVSYILSRQLVIALERLGYKANIRKDNRGNFNIWWCLNNENGRHSNKSWWNKYGRAILVKRVETEEYDGYVYNFEVEDDNSYVLLGGTVHNCEAMACGTPTICSDYGAQLEFAEGVAHKVRIKGLVPTKNILYQPDGIGEWAEPDFDHLKEVMRFVYENYDECKKFALERSKYIREEFSWEKAAEQATQILLNSEMEFRKKLKQDHIIITFHDGPKVEILGDSGETYCVEFIDADTQLVIHSGSIKSNNWIKANRKYFTNWLIKVYARDRLLFEKKFDPTGKRVLIHLDSRSLGDTLAWIPYAEEFRKKWNCYVIVSTFWNNLFEGEYPNIEFVSPGSVVQDLYALYSIGVRDGDYHSNKNNWRLIPLQKVASDYLGLDYKEIRPRVKKFYFNNGLSKPYVAISEFSTAQAKFWNFPRGWEKIVTYLKNNGYSVVSVSKEDTRLDVIKRNGRPIEETISNILGAEFFISVGTGLSWLAWSLDVPVILISGFSEPWCEMKDCIRISNKIGCHGCFNDKDLTFDRGNWNWCPRSKNFECSRNITPEQVIKGIEVARQRVNKEVHNFCQPPTGRKELLKVLDMLPPDPVIVEVGMTRQEGNWQGDGYSTPLFAWYVEKNGGKFYSVDIDPEAVMISKKIMSYYGIEGKNTFLICADAFSFFSNSPVRKIDCLYLDVWDYIGDQEAKNDSAKKHLELFKMIYDGFCLSPNALVVIDDVFNQDTFEGKGKFVVPYMIDLGYEIVEKGYQIILRKSVQPERFSKNKELGGAVDRFIELME